MAAALLVTLVAITVPPQARLGLPPAVWTAISPLEHRVARQLAAVGIRVSVFTRWCAVANQFWADHVHRRALTGRAGETG
jgi:hypothetical protein